MKKFGKEGVSEIIGTVLLLAIAIIVFSVLAIYVLSSTTPSTSAPHTNLIGYVDNNHIILQHQGGEELDLDNIKVVVWKGEEDSCSCSFTNGMPTIQYVSINDSNSNKKWDVGEYISINATAIFGNITNWQISVVVIDEESNSIIMSGILQEGILHTTPPVATFTYAPWEPKFVNTTGTSEIIEFDASDSYDPDGGRIVTYKWDFGDGNIGYGKIVLHRYTDVGEYIVTLTVIDDEGQIGTATTGDTFGVPPPVNVTYNQPPQGTFEWQVDPEIDGTINFFANVFDPDGTIVSYYWNFGDGSTSSLPNPSHTYEQSGNYTVTLIVTDDSGEQTVIEKTITVPNIPPIAGFSYTPRNITTVLTVTFNGGEPYSFDKDGYIVSWEWDFGDGATATGAVVTHKYSNPGNYTVTLTVTDNGGENSSASKIIRVYPKPAASPPTFLIVDNTPTDSPPGAWESGIDNILDACRAIMPESQFLYAKAIDSWYFTDDEYTSPELRGERIDDSLINQFDIVIWSCGDFPGDGGNANWDGNPNTWSTPMTEGYDDTSDHVYELAEHLTGNVTAGTLLLCGTYVARDLQNYPGNGANSDEIWLGNVLGLVEPTGGIDYDPDYEPFSGRLGSDYFRGEPYYAAGILYGIANTSSGQVDVSYLEITSPIKLYALHKQSDPIFKYSLYSNGTSWTTIYSTDFETTPTGWTHGGSKDEWEWGVPTYAWGPSAAHSGSYLYGTDLDGSYNNNADCWLMMPPINLSGYVGAQLEFYHWYNIEYGYDYVYLEVSEDGGATWDVLASYTGRHRTWSYNQYDLTPYVGKTILIRWHLVSDYSVTRAGYYLDDVVVKGSQSTIPTGYYAIDAERGKNRSIILGFDLNADEITPESRANYLRNVLAWLAEGAGYVTEVWVDCNGTEEWLNQPTHFASIQDGINAVSPGGVVYVIGTSGQTYCEDVILNKSIDLIGIGNPKIHGATFGIKVTVDWAKIDGFIIEGSTDGICLYDNIARVTIQNCTIRNTTKAIHLYYSHNNTIQNNVFENNVYGIYGKGSQGNKILNNQFESISNYAVSLYYSSLNNMSSNTIINCNAGIFINSSENNIIQDNLLQNIVDKAIYLKSSTNRNIISDNTIINGSIGIYLEISNTNTIYDNVINNQTVAISIDYYSHSNTIRENRITNTTYAINLQNSSSNVIILNVIEYNYRGIYMYYSAGNVIQANSIVNNSGEAIYMVESSNNNHIMSNLIVNNSQAIYIYGCGNNNISWNEIENNGGNAISLYLSMASINGYNIINFNNISFNNGTGIYLYQSLGNYIYNNTIFDNAGEGIKLEYLSHSNNILSNQIVNHTYGIHIDRGGYNYIAYNIIEGNIYEGIILTSYSTENTIEDNTIFQNGNGIKIDTSATNSVINNTIYSNGLGISLLNSNNNVILANLIDSNSDTGIYLRSSDSNSILNNTIINNTGYGIYLLLSGGTGNRIQNNIVAYNALHGIYLNASRTATAGNNEIISNTILNNSGDGIHLYYSNINSIIQNIIYNNTGCGIYLNISDSNTLSSNEITNNLDGMLLYLSNNNDIQSNNISFNRRNGISILVSSQGDSLPVQDNFIWNNTFAGVYINSSGSNYFMHNLIWNNSYGIYMTSSSSNNVIYENNISTNNYGVYIATADCTANVFYCNNFINNTLHNESQAYDRGNNSWYKVTTGNYWSDHISTDPYTIPPGINQDKYPLLSPREWWL